MNEPQIYGRIKIPEGATDEFLYTFQMQISFLIECGFHGVQLNIPGKTQLTYDRIPEAMRGMRGIIHVGLIYLI